MTWTRPRPVVTLVALLALLPACRSEDKPVHGIVRDTVVPAPTANVEPAKERTLSPSDIPRELTGNFVWHDQSARYSVTLTITHVEEKDGELLVSGAHKYQPEDLHATVRGRIDPKSRRVTLRDVAPASAGIDTEGSFEGLLSQDLQSIEGTWAAGEAGDKADYKVRAIPKR